MYALILNTTQLFSRPMLVYHSIWCLRTVCTGKDKRQYKAPKRRPWYQSKSLTFITKVVGCFFVCVSLFWRFWRYIHLLRIVSISKAYIVTLHNLSTIHQEHISRELFTVNVFRWYTFSMFICDKLTRKNTHMYNTC